MKKALLVIFWSLSILSSYMAGAQTFTTASDTVYVTTTNGGTYHNDITNISSQAINIRWIPSTDFPQSWMDNLGICDANYCRSNTVGTQSLITGAPYTTTGTPYPVGQSALFDLQIGPGIDTCPAGVHYVTVNLRDVTNGSGTNKNITFIINKFPTSVPKTTKPLDDVTLYPNPARNELNVLFNPDADVRIISVYNLIGKAVTVYKLSSNSSAKLDIENLPSGVYFIRLIDGAGQVVATRKFNHQ
ncbi:MAG: T9SS type A sorting domain-containing protein [Bacteroidetes bacterium]|nr:T9SS type A sorting domain-containing protein [Bacteroidota bacterium]